jgi:hypothetical protein
MSFVINDKYLLVDKITKLPCLDNFIEVQDTKHKSLECYYIDNNGIVSLYSDFNETMLSSLISGDGIFIGVDHGEWIGGLIYRDYSNGLGYNDEYSINVNDNVKSIFQFNNRIYVITGIVHLMSNRGNIHELEYKNGKWEIKISINLESDPQIYKIISNNEIIIITNRSLIIFDGNKIIKKINTEAWDCLYANSLYFNNDYFFIGARSFLFSVNRTNFEIKSYNYEGSYGS